MAELRIEMEQFSVGAVVGDDLQGAVEPLEVVLEVGVRGPPGQDGDAAAIEQIDCGTF